MELAAQVAVAVVTAVFGGIAAVALWMCACILLGWATRSRAERLALAQFRREFPSLSPGFTIRRKDGYQDVVMVAHGTTRPPDRTYYAVDTATGTARLITDDRKYRPRWDR